MRIVQQSVALSYSPFLALPAPKIAGLLPAPKVQALPQPFVYAEPSLAALPDTLRAQFDKLARSLLDVSVGLLADERAEAEFALACNRFLRQVSTLYHTTIIGDPQPPLASPFAARRQQLNDTLDRMVAESKIHIAETRERVARELAALHAWENVP